MDKETETETAQGHSRAKAKTESQCACGVAVAPAALMVSGADGEIWMGWLPEVDALLKRTTRRRQD